MRMKLAALWLVLFSSSAWADATQDDWDKLAQPTVDDFAICTRTEVDRTWKNSVPATEVAKAAVSTCEQRLEPLREILAGQPFVAGKQDIAETLDQLKGEVIGAASADVEKRRKKE